ncbi:unnamed protein product, partial [Ranitomeya imitator]
YTPAQGNLAQRRRVLWRTENELQSNIAASMQPAEEVGKLQKHLALLRQEYVKLQKKLAETEKKCTLLAAQTNKEASDDSFISRLLAIVAQLYQQEQYRYAGHADVCGRLRMGRFDGAATCAERNKLYFGTVAAPSKRRMLRHRRTSAWPAYPMVTMAMLRWIYTDELDLREDDIYLTELMKLANRFQLQLLRERCEKGVMSLVNVRNCIRFYQTAEELHAITLLNYCAEIIASHWHQRFLRFAIQKDRYQFTALPFGLASAPRVFTKVMAVVIAILRSKGILLIPYFDDLMIKGPSRRDCDQSLQITLDTLDDLRKEDFSSMSAQLLYKMFKSKTQFPLHKAIKVEREDVVFLYLIEMDSQLPDKLNELDQNGDLALDLALSRKLEGIATTLVNSRADVDMVDKKGWSLLHKAIQRDDKFAANFLIKNGALVNSATLGEQETPLHLVAACTMKDHSLEVMSI